MTIGVTSPPTIELDGELLAPSSLRGLDDFSHLEVVYLFHRVDPDTYEPARAGRAGTRTGPRSASSPNAPSVAPIGSVRERVPELAWASTAWTLTVRGSSAIDGTPVLDIKPYMTSSPPAHQSAGRAGRGS